MRIFLGLLALVAVAAVILLSTDEPGTPQTPPPLIAEQLSALPQDRKGQVLIYGAYGYTGSGITRLAAEYGIRPVLAGRNESKLKAFAESVGYDYITLTLENNHDNLVQVLSRFELVAHIAGPYTYTSKPMIDAAIEAGAHYLDLTGENHVIQDQLDRDEEFRAANIMVMPAVGYDVVPTDCLNLYVANQLPDATHLQVVMDGNYRAAEGASASRGTAKSGLEVLSRPLLTRSGGDMVPMGDPKVIQRLEGDTPQTLVQIPWADVMTSWVSTGIPNIEVYQVQAGDFPTWLVQLAQYKMGRRFLNWLIDNTLPEGPPPEAQQQRLTRIVSTVTNANGDSVSAALITPEAYLLTFHSTLLVAKRIIDGYWEPGFQTPAAVYGPNLVLDVPGTERTDL